MKVYEKELFGEEREQDEVEYEVTSEGLIFILPVF